MIKTHYSMLKPPGEGLGEGLVTIKLVEEQRHELKILVTSADGLSFSKAELTHRMGYLFDMFMYFASLETVSLDAVKSVGLAEL